jgi:hypothetical protein
MIDGDTGTSFSGNAGHEYALEMMKQVKTSYYKMDT